MQNYTAPLSFRLIPNPYVFILLRQTETIQKSWAETEFVTNKIRNSVALYSQLDVIFDNWNLEGYFLFELYNFVAHKYTKNGNQLQENAT